MSADCTPQGASAASTAVMKITTRAMPEVRIANCSNASRLSPVESITRRPNALVPVMPRPSVQSISITSMVASAPTPPIQMTWSTMKLLNVR